MSAVQPFARDDTFLGVCHALGRDFRVNPTLLRIPLAFLLFFHPVAVAAGYVAAGIFIALLHWFLPDPAPAEAEAPPADRMAEQAIEAEPARLAA